MSLLGAIASVEVAGDTLVFKDNGPGNGGRIYREKDLARSEGKRLHTLHDTLEADMESAARAGSGTIGIEFAGVEKQRRSLKQIA